MTTSGVKLSIINGLLNGALIFNVLYVESIQNYSMSLFSYSYLKKFGLAVGSIV